MADEFAETTDAALWAKEFVARFGGDEGLMIAWFANAMEVGRRAGEQADPWQMAASVARASAGDAAYLETVRLTRERVARDIETYAAGLDGNAGIRSRILDPSLRAAALTCASIARSGL